MIKKLPILSLIVVHFFGGSTTASAEEADFVVQTVAPLGSRTGTGHQSMAGAILPGSDGNASIRIRFSDYRATPATSVGLEEADGRACVTIATGGTNFSFEGGGFYSHWRDGGGLERFDLDFSKEREIEGDLHNLTNLSVNLQGSNYTPEFANGGTLYSSIQSRFASTGVSGTGDDGIFYSNATRNYTIQKQPGTFSAFCGTQPTRAVTVVVVGNALTNSPKEEQRLGAFAAEIEDFLISRGFGDSALDINTRYFRHTDNKLLEVYRQLSLKTPNATFRHRVFGISTRAALSVLSFPDFAARVVAEDETVAELQANILDALSTSANNQTFPRSADLLGEIIAAELQADRAVLLVPYSKGSAITNLATQGLANNSEISPLLERLSIVAVAPTTSSVARNGTFVVEDDDLIVRLFGGPTATHDNGDALQGTDVFRTSFGLSTWVLDGFGHSLPSVYMKDGSATQGAILQRIESRYAAMQQTMVN